MWTKFNVNEYVRVKLTDTGRVIEKDRHEDFQRFIESIGGERRDHTPIKEDSDGWSKWQLHNLMEIFGAHCIMGKPVPFETEIEFWCGD